MEMRVRKLILSIAAFVLALEPLLAQPLATGAQPPHGYRDTLEASALRARILGVEMRIDALHDRQLLGPAETQDLHARARELTRRVHGMGAKDAPDIETQLGLLERRVGYAMDDARWSRHAYREGEDRHVDEHPYQRDPHSDYRNFDRYTAPPVDRWHDPFDRGCCL